MLAFSEFFKVAKYTIHERPFLENFLWNQNSIGQWPVMASKLNEEKEGGSKACTIAYPEEISWCSARMKVVCTSGKCETMNCNRSTMETQPVCIISGQGVLPCALTLTVYIQFPLMFLSGLFCRPFGGQKLSSVVDHGIWFFIKPDPFSRNVIWNFTIFHFQSILVNHAIWVVPISSKWSRNLIQYLFPIFPDRVSLWY
jgi:hypothetical protein